MKKSMKKFFALLATLCMVLAFNVTAFAATTQTGTVPSENDTATITVSNVESGAKVMAYQIVKGNYQNGLLGYVPAVEGTISDVTAPSQTEINNIIDNNLDSLTSTELKYDSTSGTYKADVAAGTWLILVTKQDSTKIYNPMIVSAAYNDQSKITEGSVDANSSVDTTKLTGGEAYAKSSTPDVDKDIVEGQDTEGKDITTKINDVAIGDSVSFKITGTIPSYSSEYYDSAVYYITDILEKGLTPPDASAVTVTVGGSTIDDAYYTVEVSGQTITVTFTSDYILSLADKSVADRTVVVTYDATLNDQADLNFDPNTNEVYVNYTDTPGNVTEGTHHTTDTHTFDINPDVKKVNEDSTSNLAGAIFKLTNGTKTYYAKSTSDGKVGELVEGDDYYDEINGTTVFNSFTGLDAGTYTLTEVKAPDGYSLNTSEITVTITPTYEDNKIVNYTVAFTDADGNSLASIKYTAEDTSTGSGYAMVDTPLSELPSTGGIGTYLFTIGGVALMAVAAVMIVARKRREEA